MITVTGSSTQTTLDLPALDHAIDDCRRDAVLPVLAGEVARRSSFLTEVYREQSAITAARGEAASKRRLLREGGKAGENDQVLSLALLALDDRQRALDDARRLESLREEAIDLKRRYFLSKCVPGIKD